MATVTEITAVRQNTDEPNSDNGFTDDVIEALVDDSNVSVASAIIWSRKAASYSKLVDVSEAGATRKLSDLYKHALEMADHFTPKADGSTIGSSTSGRAKVFKIVRS